MAEYLASVMNGNAMTNDDDIEQARAEGVANVIEGEAARIVSERHGEQLGPMMARLQHEVEFDAEVDRICDERYGEG